MKNRVMSGVVPILFLTAIVVFSVRFPPTLNLIATLISALTINELIQAPGTAKQYILVVPGLLFATALLSVPIGLETQTAYYVYTVIMFAMLIAFGSTMSFHHLIVLYSMALMIPTMLGTILGPCEFGNRHGMFYVIITIFSTWISDTGTSVAGSLWKRYRLCPKVNPKKTVEGVTGGLVPNVAAILVFGYIFQVFFYACQVNVSYFSLLLIGVGGAVMSVLGGLIFSLIRRSCHIKDFGELVPGHGGILDRFDSVIFVSLFVYLLAQVLPVVVHWFFSVKRVENNSVTFESGFARK